MTLWTRMRGTDVLDAIVPGKISPHLLTGVMAEVGGGGMTAAEGLGKGPGSLPAWLRRPAPRIAVDPRARTRRRDAREPAGV